MLRSPINFMQWIEEHRELLKPPVGNQLVWEDTEFMIMVVGGPNSRKDYHVNQGEEFFYQIEGDITLKVIDEGQPKDLPIRQGEILLLPGAVPHSPQRPAHTVGLVIERKRLAGENDGFQWYCENCGEKLYEEFLHVTNIVTQLPPVFERFFSNSAHTTCQNCGTVMQAPTRPAKDTP
ncbi:3-hydroxyanthranilate 3,4-dioxygenase [bacterium (Candidatus Blackallbacteria) CG17_big_fil_post_rev_8_21_14_2_50_48_46]|uniref:3-hydroxyanthranilate 3,4-dioxygenase n=1 Tax=bacterium (Candidatus Blackallbacteria) CG17_big_fil_post_rev_8_21_14_2_50_48_46 TaxID=2014261 RepID=A0A2M7G248_9BACT|nr:MAG: 3-hydroxyanthranilate 3,4-dioxygenase [bacterium (Candidatus Blackallbacteria) CG18_big_fil_WC_8_21_14_2_50_49_26]PIW15864.1 MAG: 3-hydroxyanthranilate 3,4-dioxygenase [bacterium (Candidatus Blackallbacteria) CG17_big_fil_post_rev_8_21_14_2_50_48_46]PIW49433.1 MAG: 3-hydroxyanthranilate 3,4-dioxygenase [bacterium (Candidatus Blackallbacteria) CG13_big_fil_rev_8_21_14_2_50_49_14]